MKFKTSIHKIVKNHQQIFHKDLCTHVRTRGVNMCTRVLSRKNARAHVYASWGLVYARIFTKNHLIILYYLMNKSLKFHKDWSFRCWDICKTILTFVLFLIFYVFSIFSKFEHQNSINIENYKLVIWSFGNLISKCSGIAKILPPILVRTVVFNRNYKEKLFIQLLMITLYFSKSKPQKFYYSRI